jgi:hypothetical protein
MNFVGFTTTAAASKDLQGLWFEVIEPARLAPANLHAAQFALRLGR